MYSEYLLDIINRVDREEYNLRKLVESNMLSRYEAYERLCAYTWGLIDFGIDCSDWSASDHSILLGHIYRTKDLF